jgi:adenylate cyclase class 2
LNTPKGVDPRLESQNVSSKTAYKNRNPMQNANFLEIEVKFLLSAVEPTQTAILDLGAEPSPRVFETNIRYEDAANTFRQRKMLLRLRTDTKTTLTLKSQPPQADPDFKVHHELEVDVSNFNTMDAILKGLGYHQAQRYEKWRQTFRLNDTSFCIDSLPFGDFLEIEGPRAAISDLARRIGLPWQRRILYNYLEIFDTLKQIHKLPFGDVTFENFKATAVDIEVHRHLFETHAIAAATPTNADDE